LSSRIYFEAKKVLFTKGILFAYQSVEKRLKEEKRTPRRRKSVYPRFISELFSPSTPVAKNRGDLVPKLGDLSKTENRDSFYSKEYVTQDRKREK